MEVQPGRRGGEDLAGDAERRRRPDALNGAFPRGIPVSHPREQDYDAEHSEVRHLEAGRRYEPRRQCELEGEGDAERAGRGVAAMSRGAGGFSNEYEKEGSDY